MQKIHAAVGVIVDQNNKILITQRRPGKVYEGYWELPGGKIEPKENATQAIKREFFEELGIDNVEAEFLNTVEYQYPEFMVVLEVFKIKSFTGKIYGKEGQQIAWLDPGSPDSISPLLPASNQILDLL